MDARLQKRYLQLVREQMNPAQAVAAGLKALPGTAQAFAATQAAWRFFANERVTLSKLVEPLRAIGCQAAHASASPYALLVHDWSKMDYDGHSAKKDLVQLSNEYDWGYEQMTALLVDATDGSPLAPMEVAVWAAAGVHTTRHDQIQKPVGHLEQVLPTMQASRGWTVTKTLVHVIDREADSVNHFRKWTADGHLFLVRADDRRVRYRDQSCLLSDIVRRMRREQAFRHTREVAIRGRTGQQWVAETEIVLAAPGWTYNAQGKKKRVPGQALTLRFVAVQVRDEQGKNLAEWFLLTNVPPDSGTDQIALWYYWRWRIESFHKLLKSAGLELESWQQESAQAIAKRLLVGCMACVTVWHLERQTTPEAQACQQFLVRLSGRQMKRTRPVTTPALLAGLHVLVVMLEVLETKTPDEIRDLARSTIPLLRLTG